MVSLPRNMMTNDVRFSRQRKSRSDLGGDQLRRRAISSHQPLRLAFDIDAFNFYFAPAGWKRRGILRPTAFVDAQSRETEHNRLEIGTEVGQKTRIILQWSFAYHPPGFHPDVFPGRVK